VDQGDAVQPTGPQPSARWGHLGADSIADLLVAQSGPVKELQDLELVFREPLNEVPEAIPLARDRVQTGPLQAALKERQGLLDLPLYSQAPTIRGHLSGQLIGDLLQGHVGVETQAYHLVQLLGESPPQPPEEPHEAVADDIVEIILARVGSHLIGGQL
jgi:hypothetical protein